MYGPSTANCTFVERDSARVARQSSTVAAANTSVAIAVLHSGACFDALFAAMYDAADIAVLMPVAFATPIPTRASKTITNAKPTSANATIRTTTSRANRSRSVSVTAR